MRKRYWARSLLGWPALRSARPNVAHTALAQLQRNVRLGQRISIVTQNVDSLHLVAGSPPADLIELHGHLRDVQCLDCNTVYSRDAFQDDLRNLNPAWGEILDSNAVAAKAGDAEANVEPMKAALKSKKGMQRPDGDREIDGFGLSYQDFVIPPCGSCGSDNRQPTVVFFGGFLDKHIAEASIDLAEKADALLVVGSSLTTYSSFRLARRMYQKDAPIAMVSIGPSRADKFETMLKIEALASAVLPKLVL